MAEQICTGKMRLHKEIFKDLNDADEGDSLLLRQGFSFDILFDAGERACELVELNVFGVRMDRRLLYGDDSEDLVLRAAL
ncbi:hypothetical protein TOPH_08730 [Tolypocladium ophioglossoides CBS 100239]|uniref:Uncharacterized protein n=1 Tax=Tolypocladium ophioglossoides (strain CBS 100239) TaxID=1163406 RepID=A0A0L0MXX5_TOLOC|nr:hypothetical protein TOPH_08730 [Tolypocladium ophioglossoides CBS 100239]